MQDALDQSMLANTTLPDEGSGECFTDSLRYQRMTSLRAYPLHVHLLAGPWSLFLSYFWCVKSMFLRC